VLIDAVSLDDVVRSDKDRRGGHRNKQRFVLSENLYFLYLSLADNFLAFFILKKSRIPAKPFPKMFQIF
jgi:hypothetical protein